MPKKILLADDSITIQKVVELTFSDGDYEVIATSNGAKAIQRLADVRPDIILSDIIMPEKNGYEVCEYVKSSPEFRHIPVILLTGTFEPFDPDRAEKAGCDAVVTKPFESQSLIHKVEELIAQSQQGTAAAEEPPPAVEEPSPFAAAVPAAFEAFGTTPPPPAAEEPAAPSWSSYAQEEPSPFAATEEPEPSWGSEAPAADAPFTEPPSFEEPVQHFGEEPRAAYESEPMFEEPAPAFGGEEPSSFQEPEQAFGSEPSFAAPEPAFGGEPSFPESERTFEEPELETRMPEAAPEEETYKLHGDELFEAASRTSEEQSLSFEGAEGGDVAATRAFPKLDYASLSGTERDLLPPVEEQREDAFSFDRPEPATSTFPPFEEAEVSPTDETATRSLPEFGYESTTEPADAFGEPEAELPEAAMEEPSAPPAEVGAVDFDEPVSAETKMLPRLTLEDMQRFREEGAAENRVETPAWEPPAPLEFPRVPQTEAEAPAPLSFDAPQGETFESADEAAPFTVGHTIEAPSPWTPPSDEPEEQAAASPWEEEPVAEPELPIIETEASAFGTEEETPFEPEQEEAAAPSTGEALPFAAPPAAEEQEVAWSEEPAATAEENVAEFPRQEEPAAALPGTAAAVAFSGDLTEEQIERIARRVVELMSERMVKDIAWEVIPDLAEIVVRERIRQLETES